MALIQDMSATTFIPATASVFVGGAVAKRLDGLIDLDTIRSRPATIESRLHGVSVKSDQVDGGPISLTERGW